jgi:hypothetical protein
VDLYIYSLIRLHGAVLNQINTGTTLPLSYRVWIPIVPERATCPNHLILLGFIISIIHSEEYNLLSSSLRSFLQPPTISSLFGPNITVYRDKSLRFINHPYCNALRNTYRGLDLHSFGPGDMIAGGGPCRVALFTPASQEEQVKPYESQSSVAS